VNGEGDRRPASWSTVRETGIVLLHEGDKVSHAPGSEAVLERAEEVVEYHFPVEIEVRVAGETPDWRLLAELTANGLDDTLRSI
jgi:hypothetical protein